MSACIVPDAVQHLRKLARESKISWLVLGKGPTFERRERYQLAGFHKVALNHACLPLTPHGAGALYAHFTDLEAFDDCAAHLLQQRIPTIMPWVPHVLMVPGKHNLKTRLGEDPRLAELLAAKLLYSYNSTRVTVPKHNRNLSLVRVRLFSAVAVVNLLAEAGVRSVYTLGVDGGRAYARDFAAKDRLANGQPSFDAQFAEIDKTCKRTGLAVTPLALPRAPQ